MGYNMSGFEACNNIWCMYAEINTASNNWLSYLLLLGVFVVMLITLLRNNPPAESFTGASTLSTVLSLFFLLAELISVEWVIGFTLVFAMSAVSLYIQNRT